MKTFVINLKRRSDRRNYMEVVLPPSLNPEFTTDWEAPTDGKDINAIALDGYGVFSWQINSTNPWWNRPLWKGEVGCAVSHWLCWKKALESDDNLFLFLEDDIYFSHGTWDTLDDGIRRISRYDPEWELLYLGRTPNDVDTFAIMGIVKPGYSYDSHAYLLTKSGVEKAITTNFCNSIVPVDEFLPAMYIDHPREDVRKRYPKCMSAYAFEPPLAYQLSKSLATSDVKENVEFFIP